MARGPLIQKNNIVKPFHTTDLYNLFCDILNLEPAKNNGTTAIIDKILIRKKSGHGLSTVITVGEYNF